ncbi:hypothetical protein HTV45_28095 [Streptomyces sp. CHD11]|uniref:hypothetical protein n=1 Tax=Streptomyces sp. CHD11 TaxID=2741325 RepID=UPI001BFC0088|nr:hypothetical protein [Streptomyces sp. CHD11]MBT3154688.1 hypothetical protein [Streptomyces sp. CHD11]
MSFGQGGPPQQWDPWKPNSQQPQQPQQPWSGDGGGGGQSPDWAALADASEARAKRRRLLFIGGGALATVAIGTAVAVAVVSANGGDQASPGASSQLPGATDVAVPSPTGTVPSFAPTSAPPPLDPNDFIASAVKDKAPLSPDILFPGTQLTMGGTVYKKGPTADTGNCASAARATLPKALTDNGCTRLIRVTYTKDDVAVTVGVAVFDTQAQAAKARGQTDGKSIVKSLSGGGVKDFCSGAVCRSTRNALGRYAYFTLAGFTDGKDVTEKDKAVFATGDDLQEFTFRQIRRRGEAQASAAAQAG